MAIAKRLNLKWTRQKQMLHWMVNESICLYVYYMLNKPVSGVVSATEDKREKTVIDLIKGQKRKDLFPVGRLDKIRWDFFNYK